MHKRSISGPLVAALATVGLSGVRLAAQNPIPIVTFVQNNYSYVLPGLPNYGIAPGSLFIIKGTGLSVQPLSPLQSSAPPGLPTSLNGVSVSITVGGVTITPGIYYTSPAQIAAVLPSTTPTGDGTLVVKNQGLSNFAAQTNFPNTPIHVVPSAVGLDTLDGTGSGAAVAQDANFVLLSPSHPATPGQTIILWGSGVGADSSNDDRTFPMHQNNLTEISMEVDVGGIPAIHDRYLSRTNGVVLGPP